MFFAVTVAIKGYFTLKDILRFLLIFPSVSPKSLILLRGNKGEHYIKKPKTQLLASSSSAQTDYLAIGRIVCRSQLRYDFVSYIIL